MRRSGKGGRPAPQRYAIIRPSLPNLGSLGKDLNQMWKSGQVTAGPCVRAFEAALEKNLGVRHAVAVSSCTSGLILAVRAMELTGEGYARYHHSSLF